MATDGRFSEGHPPADILAPLWDAEGRGGDGKTVPNGERPIISGVAGADAPSDGAPRCGEPSGGHTNARSYANPPDVAGFREQAEVVTRALHVFAERNAKRNDAWRQAGAKGQLVEMRKKLDRLWATWGREVDQKDIDEAVDLINAVAFWIRCVESDNFDGQWPWPS